LQIIFMSRSRVVAPERTAARQPGLAAAYLERGNGHERLGAMREAAADWKKASELGVREAAERLKEWERKRALLARRRP
jgi:hypothetical protein